MTVLSIFLIKIGANALIVKSVVPIVYIIRTVAIALYAKNHYKYLDFSVKPKKSAFKQKNSALLHQVVGMICNNTDVILLTIMVPVNALVQVSVYTIYNYVSYAITSLFNSISTGIRASFGQVIAENDEVNFTAYLIIYMSIVTTSSYLLSIHVWQY